MFRFLAFSKEQPLCYRSTLLYILQCSETFSLANTSFNHIITLVIAFFNCFKVVVAKELWWVEVRLHQTCFLVSFSFKKTYLYLMWVNNTSIMLYNDPLKERTEQRFWRSYLFLQCLLKWGPLLY